LREAVEISREEMVKRLRSHYGIKDEKTLGVMESVPRHFFVPQALQAQAYGDHALPIAGGQTISQPFIVARMTELLEIEPTARVLEIGAGSGYQTAVLASIARAVYAIERLPELANEAQNRLRQFGFRNVTLRSGDGTNGWEVYSPYDGILVAAGGPEVPEPLLRQLKPGGKLVIPIGQEKAAQRLTRYTREQMNYTVEDFGPCSFVPLIGRHGWR
jgi:protein-L-isoaspartate(D-aspartate) O-methyltransferase